MKINTISAYVLVYLLARGHWNLMVPVRADDADGSSGGLTSVDAGSAAPAGGDASSTVATPAANESGSTASADAGSTAGGSAEGTALTGSAGGSGSPTRARSKAGSSAGDVADVSSLSATDPDGNDASITVATPAPEGSTASTDADAGSGLAPAANESGSTAGEGTGLASPAEGASSGGNASTDADAGHSKPAGPILNGLYPDFFTGGMSADEAPMTNPELVAKREDAKRLADHARKAAEELLKKADELSEAIEKTGDLQELTAKVDATAYQVSVETSRLHESALPPDMKYYGGFPDGHHYRATDDMLIKLYKLDRRANNEMYSDSFPDGWHAAGYGLSDIIIKEAKAFRDKKYAEDREAKKLQIDNKEKAIAENENLIASKREEMKKNNEASEVKHAELAAKRQEISKLREQIAELYKKLSTLETEARALAGEHGGLISKYNTMELELKKLADDKRRLQYEHAVLEEEDRNLVRDYYELSGRTSHFDGKPTATDTHVDPRDNFSFTEELGLLEAGEGAVIHKYIGDLNPADTFSEHPLYTGASVSGESLEPLAAGHAEAGTEESESVDASSTVPAEDNSVATPAEGVSVVAEPTPAAEHVASTPVPAPVPEAPANEGEVKAESGQSVPAALKLFKTDADGNEVEMVETTDYEKKTAHGDDRYEFKSGVKCVKVMFGNHELWKKGDENVQEPKHVGYNDTVKALLVRDNDKSVVYKKESDSDNWKHLKTVARQTGSGSGRTAAHTGSSAGSTPAPESTDSSAPGSLSSGLSGSVVNLETASTGSGEANETSSVTSEAPNLNEVNEADSGSALRGAGAAAE